MIDETRDTHETYCTVSFSNGQIGGDGLRLFATEVPCPDFIRLEIHEADNTRRLCGDHIYPHKKIIEVYLSPMQFINLITHVNQSCGTPGTLHYRDGKYLDVKRHNVSTKELFDDDLKLTLNKVVTDLDNLKDSIENTDKPLGVKQKAAVTHALSGIASQLKNNLSFVIGMYRKEMERIATESKINFEAYVTNTIQRHGIDNIKKLSDEKE